jgi:hypothetical protein
MSCLKIIWIALLVVLTTKSAVAQISMEVAQQKQMDIPACATGIVDLPPGWSVATMQNGMTTLKMAGTDDVAVAGVMTIGTPETIVTAILSQTSSLYTITKILPVKQGARGMVDGSAALMFADGRRAVKYALAGKRAAGGIAVAAITTTELQNEARLQTAMQGIGRVMSQLIVGRDFSGAISAQQGKGAPALKSPLPPGAVVASSAQQLSGQIDMIAFYLRYQFQGFGVGSVVPTPVVLFKNGEALYDISVLKKSAADIAAHRQKYPDEWTKWRRVNGKLQLLEKKGWDGLAFDTVMSSLPRGLKLAGTYRATGTANFSSSGFTSNILAWDDLSFLPDGRFQGGGGANTTSSYDSPAVSTSTAIPARSAARFGRYAIDGYTLTLRYDDGRIEQRMITADPKELNVIYLDGDGYIRQKADQQK